MVERDVEPNPLEFRFLQLMKDLRNSDSVTVMGEVRGGVSAEMLDSWAGLSMLEELYDVVPDPSLADHHIRYSEFGIHWAEVGDSVGAGGEFVLRELAGAIMSGPPDSENVRDDAQRDLFRQLRVIDYQPEGGVAAFSAVRLNGRFIDPRVWVYRFPYGAFELDLDYRGYLEALLLTKGFYGWQFLYSDVQLTGAKYEPIVRLIRTGLDFLAAVFPDSRYEELEVRLSERQQ
ncbi:hypothetical protein [Streptomyces sp. NPDC085479]|uniref:hypothetical protein n=1 Tax=Streptomyces sp. NPDC085479 TaxID=3365726 RepID=UPI0037D91791